MVDVYLLVYIDIETTGLSVFNDRIIQLAALCSNDLNTHHDSFNSYVNPERPIPDFIQYNFGIKQHMVDDESTISVVMSNLFRWIESHRMPNASVLYIAHNAKNFDIKFITQELLRHKMTWPTTYSSYFFDSLVWARKTKFRNLKSKTLSSIYSEVVGGSFDAHNALADCIALESICMRVLSMDTLLSDKCDIFIASKAIDISTQEYSDVNIRDDKKINIELVDNVCEDLTDDYRLQLSELCKYDDIVAHLPKHRGKTFRSIINIDTKYVKWLLSYKFYDDKESLRYAYDNTDEINRLKQLVADVRILDSVWLYLF